MILDIHYLTYTYLAHMTAEETTKIKFWVVVVVFFYIKSRLFET